MRMILPFSLFLSACGAVAPGMVSTLARQDPLSVDPAAFVLRMPLPEGTGLATEPALTLHVEVDGAVLADERYALQVRGSDYALTPEAAADLRARQAEIAAMKASGGHGSAALGIGAGFCGLRPERLDAELSLDGGESFGPFLRGMTLDDIIGDAQLPPCD